MTRLLHVSKTSLSQCGDKVVTTLVNRVAAILYNLNVLYGIRSFESQLKSFVDSFIYLYPAKHITPYMHCMMYHVAEFMVLDGSILPFTQQGQENTMISQRTILGPLLTRMSNA